MYHDIKNRPELVVRKIPFTFSECFKAIWNPSKPEWSHMVNGASLTMPYLEPFLIRTVRETIKLIKIDELKADAKGFMAQEGQHFINHQRYNDLLKANGYQCLQNVEDQMKQEFTGMQSKNLQWRLAYTAGFETMTVGMTEWLINDRKHLFGGADPSVASFILWHMVEETEHKNVAFDLYQYLYPEGYFRRLYGLFKGSTHIAILSRRGYKTMLEQDGKWNTISSRLRLYGMVARFCFKAMPAVFKAAMPNYHPSKVKDPSWVAKYVETYTHLEQGEIPLLDTSDPEITPRFNPPS
ncbi:MAG: putative metal-dependent hydrolase [Arenicella sp.]|jgi:predicted metal-dependent hydrolase